MYIGFKHLHSSIAYLVLIIILFSILYAFYGFLKDKTFTNKSKRIMLITLILSHSQMMVGFILYFVSPLGFSNLSSASMKNPATRLLILEHPIMMLLGIVCITLGYSKAKRINEDRKKYKYISLFYSLGLILILSKIPWNNWI